MTKLAQTDFSGGLFEAVSPGDFTDRQLPVVKGFVLENEVSLRSQPPCQKLNSTPLVALRIFRGRSKTWLLGTDSDGRIWYAPAPSRTASNAAAAQTAWRAFSTDADPKRRFLCEVPAGKDETAYRGGWLLNSLEGTSDPIVIGETSDGSDLVQLDLWTKRYATQSKSGSEVIPGVGVMPHADLGVMWGDYLVLARIRWYKSSESRSKALSASTTKAYKNALYVSAVPEKKSFDAGGDYQEFRIDQWSPNDVITGVIPAEATVLNLLVVEAGLLVFHTHGLVLLRGSAREPKPEVLTELAGAGDTAVSQSRLAAWPALGAACFVESGGTVWATDGGKTSRLDLYTKLGAPTPATGADSLAAVGPFLVVARGKRMMAFRMFQEDGAWTELVHPGTYQDNYDSTPTQLCSAGDSLYFLWNGGVYRYVFDSDVGRGTVADTLLKLEVGSPTWGTDDSQERRGWFRVGVTATGVDANAQLLTVACNAGPALAPERSWTTSVFRTLGRREQVVVPAGIGPAPEASVTVLLAGDVRLESLFVETYGKSKVR